MLSMTMTYDAWKKELVDEYTILLRLDHYLNGEGHKRMKVLEALYLLAADCDTAEALLDKVERQDMTADDVNWMGTSTAAAWLGVLHRDEDTEE